MFQQVPITCAKVYQRCRWSTSWSTTKLFLSELSSEGTGNAPAIDPCDATRINWRSYSGYQHRPKIMVEERSCWRNTLKAEQRPLRSPQASYLGTKRRRRKEKARQPQPPCDHCPQMISLWILNSAPESPNGASPLIGKEKLLGYKCFPTTIFIIYDIILIIHNMLLCHYHCR